MTDEWNHCFNPAMGLTPKDFSDTWCRVCMNSGCSRSAASGSKWQNRMSTQVERLITNPNFADPRDPAFREVRKLDFPSLFQEAMRLEISDRKGDWTVPTAQDVRDFVQGTLATPGPKPEPPEAPVAPPPNLSVEVEEDVLYRMRVRGSADPKTHVPTEYDVRLVSLPAHPEGQEWRCSCPAWAFGRARPCKHVEYVEAQYTTREPETPAPAPAPTVEPPRPRVFVPPAVPLPAVGNTPSPPGGAYVGAKSPSPASRPDIRHAAAPAPRPVQGTAPDPWAAPPGKGVSSGDIIVPVGGRVTMGGPKKS